LIFVASPLSTQH